MTEHANSDIPSLLEVLKNAREFEKGSKATKGRKLRIGIVTNFTDDLLKKTLTGLCVMNGISPDLYTVPYKQYLFELKNKNSELVNLQADIIFIYFDINNYIESEFTNNPNHLEEVIDDLTRYLETYKGILVIQTCLSSSDRQHNRLFRDNQVSKIISIYNQRLVSLAEKFNNVHLIDTDKIALGSSTSSIYDLKNLYASSQPFSHEFLFRISNEWFAYLNCLAGRARKCLVLDLDNTLWGGVIGEAGPLGIALGPTYPGNAFVAFQRIVLEYYNQGIILAINSRNNMEDVKEVFEKNHHMVLKESHFACIVANWETKADNLRLIAKELNIGLDSLVFIDDDSMNRDLVRKQLPEVSVPDFSLRPEDYAYTILNLNEFHTLAVTEEDKKRGEMYRAEQERKEVLASAPSLEEYLATLNIEVEISINNTEAIPRLAQMTQKTNQFNLTTKRATESDVTDWINNGALVYSGEVKDNFGSYGLTIMSTFHPHNESELLLDVCLMSCRVMGREVEHTFFEAIAEDLLSRGYKVVHATFIPTPKNIPSKEYLSAIGGKKVEEKDGATVYLIDLSTVIAGSVKKKRPIKINIKK